MDKENYFFEIKEENDESKLFVLIIYDIVDNKQRIRLSKLLLGYGFRIQKSAFEAIISRKKYKELLEKIPQYVKKDDSIRIYKIIGKGQIKSFGKPMETSIDDVVVI